jgi:hypothetical protein
MSAWIGTEQKPVLRMIPVFETGTETESTLIFGLNFVQTETEDQLTGWSWDRRLIEIRSCMHEFGLGPG